MALHDIANRRHAEKALALSAQWGVDVTTNNLEAAKQADLILVGVKPTQVPGIIAEIRPALTKDKTIVSIAAPGSSFSFFLRDVRRDHPILLTVPETLYLKCLILEVM